MKIRRGGYASRMLVCIAALISLTLLGGCMYPKEMKKENQTNPSEYIAVVQQSIETYHQKKSVYPIKNSDMDTPLYEKYVIDFQKLKNSGYLTNLPANAYESGGDYMYVLVDPEDKPRVKMFDLIAYRAVSDIQKKVYDYFGKNNAAVPGGELYSPGFYYVDFDKLNMKAPEIKSVFNRQSLIHFLVHETGKVAIDYGPDLAGLIREKQLQPTLKKGQKLLPLLVEEGHFVPIQSFDYEWDAGKQIPVPVMK
ncbi:hypothetical protein [Paenibacillus sp. FJAT-26967]|uniref:hypothetical protein n=1 Tax=Paenibacillus sp. FJAT-26967 TaxID=1729690 RepID=UPI0020A3100F|nr:hypothetical protein [Paenibacillus sp. FJAT-26967]